MTTSKLTAQGMECGTPDFPPAQMEQILASLPNNPIVASGAPIPISIYFFQIRETDGSTNHPGYDFTQHLGIINQYFDGIFEFSVCGSEFIDSSDYYHLDLVTEATGLHNFVNANYDPIVSHCVKVFLVRDITVGIRTPAGYTHERFQYNENSAVYFSAVSNEIIGHELGHYFGLPHTYANPATQYVNSPVLINGDSVTCQHTGDGFCDTPADLENVCYEDTACTTVTCDDPDPLGVPYSPDQSLLMSDYLGCTNRFTDDQAERMLTLYNYDDNYEALHEIPEECAIKTGKILNHCITGMNQFPDPFSELKVIVREAPQNCFDFTDGIGNYDIKPAASCSIGIGKRSILPDLDFTYPLNGVTTYDLVLLSKHILGIDTFDSPFKKIAGDANNSGSVTTFDIVTIRKVILGIDSIFAEDRSWRYIPNLFLGNAGFRNQFNANPFTATILDPFGGSTAEREYLCPPNPLNPGAPPPPIPNTCTWMDHITVIPTDPLAQVENTWSFTGVKVGDVNCSADVNGLQEPPPSEDEFDSETGFPIAISQGAFKKIQVIAHASQEVVAWQFGTSFPASDLQVGSFLSGNTASTFDPDNLHLINGGGSETGISHLNALWFSPNGEGLAINNKVLFEFTMQALNPISSLENLLQLNASVTPLKFYNVSGEEISVNLTLNAVNLNEMKGGRTNERTNANLQLKNANAIPNPFGGIVDFSFELGEDAFVKIRVFNIDGRLISERGAYLSQGQNDIQMSGLEHYPPGIYTYFIASEGTMYRGKLVKK
ncbi:MAG: T9SS type A sorting domain-containing protein [Saprospiraceae bacterium]